MTLQVIDLLHPRGALKQEALWPRFDGESVDDRESRVEETVQQYLDDGYSRTTDDDAARLWVYYRAWSEKADDLNAIPATASNDEGARSYLQSQIAYWTDRAAQALAEFEDLTVVGGASGDYQVITSLR